MNQKQSDMLVSLGRERIMYLGREFLKKGSIDLESLIYLRGIYNAYIPLGGNGEAKTIMEEVEKLPISERR